MYGRTLWLGGALALVLSLCGLGCEAPPHPAQQTAQRFLEALQYGDAQALYGLHAAGSVQSPYCGVAQFERALLKVRSSKDPERCAQAKLILSSKEADTLDDEIALLLQLQRFVCEHPDGGCEAYGALVFRSQLEQSASFKRRPQQVKLHKLIDKDDEAVAYIDLIYAQPAQVEHKLLKLRRFQEQGWLITTTLDELLGQAQPPAQGAP